MRHPLYLYGTPAGLLQTRWTATNPCGRRVRLNWPVCFLSRSAHRAIHPLPLLLAKDQLPQLALAGAEESGAAQQVVFPHAVKALAVFCFQAGPGFVEVLPPCHQGAVIIRAEVDRKSTRLNSSHQKISY